MSAKKSKGQGLRRVSVNSDGIFHCICGATHSRGPVNGSDVYRCLACGYDFRIKKSAQRAEKPLPFRALMTKERNGVHEHLQLGGDFPECTPSYACDLDWLHVIMIATSDAAEFVRLDSHEPSPTKTKAIKRRLAIIAAACEMWSDSLEEELK